jgi:hypothetical protein
LRDFCDLFDDLEDLDDDFGDDFDDLEDLDDLDDFDLFPLNTTQFRWFIILILYLLEHPDLNTAQLPELSLGHIIRFTLNSMLCVHAQTGVWTRSRVRNDFNLTKLA